MVGVSFQLHVGNALDVLPTLQGGSVQACVTSPPYYGHRFYNAEHQVWGDTSCTHDWGETQKGPRKDLLPFGTTKVGRIGTDARKGQGVTDGGRFCRHCGAWIGQLGLEPTVALYAEHLVAVFRALQPVLADTGSLFLNLGDSYRTGSGQDGIKDKDLIGIPWRVAFALQDDGWYLRNDLVWAKPNPSGDSTSDRATRAHEYVFHLTKSKKYLYHRGPETTVITAPTQRGRGGHTASMPEALVKTLITLSSNSNDIILDPFAGTGTTGVAAADAERGFVGVELSETYAEAIARPRLKAAYATQRILEVTT